MSSDTEDTRPLLKKQGQKGRPNKKEIQGTKDLPVRRGRTSSGRVKKIDLSDSGSTETSSNSGSSSSCVTTSDDDDEEEEDEDEDDEEYREARQRKIGKMEKLKPLGISKV